jgi:pimeloyl-ACP methyl ester carboxylesterase
MTRNPRLARWAIMLSIVLAAVFLAPVANTAANAATGDATCSAVEVPVSLAEGLPRNQRIAGQLCRPAGSEGRPLQLLVHGFSYDRHYWDLPGFNGKYSYVKTMNDAGYPTLAIDRLGSGQSSYPLSVTVTLISNVVALHQVVQAARGGALPGGSFARVVLVGHSYGSITSISEAGTYHDVDGVVATGVTHTLAPIGLGAAGVSLLTNPAMVDPRFAPMVKLDPGYVSTRPGTRGDLFYSPSTSDPAVIAADEATKSTGTLVELGTLPPYIVLSAGVTVPVIVINGQFDWIFCREAGGLALESCANDQALLQSERPFWPNAAQLEAYVLPGSGHSVNFATNVDLFRNRVVTWLGQHFRSS